MKGPKTTFPDDSAYPSWEFTQRGLTKREYFASMAMQGMLAHPGTIADMPQKHPDTVAKAAVIYADALIEELNKEEKQDVRQK